MKKFLTLVAFTCALVPTIQSMEPKITDETLINQYQNQISRYEMQILMLKLIQDANVQTFKSIFGSLTLPIESIIELEQAIIERKKIINVELDSLGDTKRNWPKIVKGTLATIGGGIVGVSMINTLSDKEKLLKIKNENRPYRDDLLHDINFYGAIGMLSVCGFGIVCACLMYGYKNIKAGLNYKKYLQNQLARLDEIAAHIAQAKGQATHA